MVSMPGAMKAVSLANIDPKKLKQLIATHIDGGGKAKSLSPSLCLGLAMAYAHLSLREFCGDQVCTCYALWCIVGNGRTGKSLI